MRSTHPYSLMEDDAPKRVIGLHSTSMDILVHPSMQSPLEDDVSLHGDILLGRPLDHQMMGDASHVGAPLIVFRGVETLGDNYTVLRVLGRLKDEGAIPSISFPPTFISDSTLWQKQ